MSDILDLLNPESIARLRHSLRTPLNQLIGYAKMIGDEAREQRATAEATLMDQALTSARRMVDLLQEVLPVKAHIAGDAVPVLRAGLRPWLQQLEKTLTAFDELTAGTRNKESRKMRAAARDLLDFCRGVEAPSSVPVPLPPGRAGRPTSASGRILVVDDDPGNRDTLTRRLESQGFEALSVASGTAAVDRLAREPFDVVLLDMFMPGMDGFQVLTRMKTQAELQDIPVIILSSTADHEAVVRCLEMGAEDFLVKPFDAVVMRARISGILRRRRAEADRSEMAESLHLLLESTGEGVLGEDRDGLCVFVNRAALDMLRCSRETLIGRDLHSAIHHSRMDGSPYPSDACPIHMVLRTGEPRRGRDEAFFRPDGSSIPVEYSAHPIRRDGRVEGVIVTFLDITERKGTEEHLVQSAKLESLGVLGGRVAHDFNNILTGILGNASLVQETLPGNDPNQEHLGEIVEACERAAELSREVLAFGGTGRFSVEAVDLSKAIQSISRLLAATVRKPARLALRIDNQLPPVEGDLQQIQQLIFNLVVNAGEAISEGPGVVTVETGVRDVPPGAPPEPPFGRITPGRYAFVRVEDTGAGMDAAMRTRIFDPFFSTKGTGRGRGLAAAMRIAKTHQGIIRVQSEPGKGSVFEALLPLAIRAVFEMPAAGNSAPGRTLPPAPHRQVFLMPAGAEAGSARTVLVVDDEEIVRQAARSVLERGGYRVLLATNGRQAVDLFRERSAEISLVLLDLTMPAMGGEETLRLLHGIRGDVPVLVSSGYNEKDVAGRFAGARVAGYVRKPYKAATLLEQVKAVVG